MRFYYTFIHFADELLSNDPPNKENPYKSFFTQIGSARPIRGLNFRTPIVRISMDWAAVKISSEKEILFSKVSKDCAFDVITPVLLYV